MDLQELIRLVEKDIKLEKECLEDKKNNIAHDYFFAKHDFRCIENMTDVLATYEHVLKLLNDVQQRVIKRNQLSISDLYNKDII